jgi:importin-7
MCTERDEILKDDFPLDGSAYDDDDEEDWAGDDTAWNEENEPEEETDAKDESTAYLEFLNEEANNTPPHSSVKY